MSLSREDGSEDFGTKAVSIAQDSYDSDRTSKARRQRSHRGPSKI